MQNSTRRAQNTQPPVHRCSRFAVLCSFSRELKRLSIGQREAWPQPPLRPTSFRFSDVWLQQVTFRRMSSISSCPCYGIVRRDILGKVKVGTSGLGVNIALLVAVGFHQSPRLPVRAFKRNSLPFTSLVLLSVLLLKPHPFILQYSLRDVSTQHIHLQHALPTPRSRPRGGRPRCSSRIRVGRGHVRPLQPHWNVLPTDFDSVPPSWPLPSHLLSWP